MEKHLQVDIPPSLNLNVGMAVNVNGTPYEGATTVIPSSSRQILPTADTLVFENITIEPIPSNYGLITWNGSVLTVS